MNHPTAIKSISISGYKSAIDTSAELGALNVLIGPNGAGKSVLLESIDLLRQTMTEDVPIPNSHVSSEDGAVTISAHLSGGQVVSAHKSPDSEFLVAQNKGNLPSGPDCWQTYRISYPEPQSEVPAPDDILRTDGSNLPRFLEYLARKKQRVHRNIFLKLDIHSVHQNKENSKDITTLSEGAGRMLALMALLESALTEKPPVLIIEHPEIMMSESFQNIVSGFMRSLSIYTQVIATTHSSVIVDGVEPEDLLIAEIPSPYAPDAQPGTSYRRLSTGEIKNLGSWLEDYSLGELWLKNVIGARP